MFLKLLGRDADSLSAAEESAVGRLAAAQRRLAMDGDRVDTKSEAGFGACAAFLDGLAVAARVLKVDAAPRSYRSAFTVNYRALFPDEARHYRVDVLEASIEQYAAIWVNGDKFEFSAEAMRRAKALQRAWLELIALLERWGHASRQARSAARPARSELRNTLVALDFAWASFEHRYIAELIAIEEKARRLVVQAVAHEERLQLLEAGNADRGALQRLPEYREEQRRLVGCIAHLNSVANVRRKGRDDLGVEVLFEAIAALGRCDAAEHSVEGTEALCAARILSTDVVESYNAMRAYLREVGHCLERVDPHLCNNTGLVERLVDWEESWEVGTRYVQNEQLLASLCDLVAHIREAQKLVPALSAMCHDFDAELFLVLPRIVWLRFLAAPVLHGELLKSLLPTAQPGDAELESFCEKFSAAKRLLVGAAQVASARCVDSAEEVAWDVLTRRAILGPDGLEESYAPLAWRHKDAAQAAAEDLMHELEQWSIKLQRHCPEDWNQCSAVLLQCLSGARQGRRQSETFRV